MWVSAEEYQEDPEVLAPPESPQLTLDYPSQGDLISHGVRGGLCDTRAERIIL
jgi:hypothetical protein